MSFERLTSPKYPRNFEANPVGGRTTTKATPANSVRQLLSGYAEAAAAHGGASKDGDHKTANCQYDIIAAVCRELRARGGPDAQLSLLELLNITE